MITNSWLRPFQNLHAPAQELHLKLAVFRGREKGCVRRQLNRGKRTAQGRSPFGLNAALRDELIPYDVRRYRAKPVDIHILNIWLSCAVFTAMHAQSLCDVSSR